MLGQIWSAVVWLASTIIVSAICVIVWAWARAAVRGEKTRRTPTEKVEIRDGVQRVLR